MTPPNPRATPDGPSVIPHPQTVLPQSVREEALTCALCGKTGPHLLFIRRLGRRRGYPLRQLCLTCRQERTR